MLTKILLVISQLLSTLALTTTAGFPTRLSLLPSTLYGYAISSVVAFPAQFINVGLFCRCSISDVFLVVCGIHRTRRGTVRLATRYKTLQSVSYPLPPPFQLSLFSLPVVYNTLRDRQGARRGHGKNKHFIVINTINWSPDNPVFHHLLLSLSCKPQYVIQE
jgi:hypothetical protein